MNGNKGKPKPWLKGRKAANRLEPGIGSMHYLLNRYKQTAKKRNLEFQLTVEEFHKLTSDCCFFCDKSPSNVIKGPRSFGNYVYNGVDRLDSSKGYTIDNSVTCCIDCNRSKWEMSLTDFNNYIERIAKSLLAKGWINV